MATGSRGVPLGNIFTNVTGGKTGVGGGFAGAPNFGQGAQDDKKAQEVLDNIKQFRMKPKEVKAYLDRYIIEQAHSQLECFKTLRSKG